MRILAVCPHFAPDVAPTGEVMTSIVGGLAERGHRLHVVTSLPWYRDHRVEADWRGRAIHHADEPWGRVTRLYPFPADKGNIPARALAFGGFTVEAALAGVVSRARPDIVFAMSPPLTLGGAGWLAARARRVPLVFNIQDVFPDVAVELGTITNPTAIAGFSWLERITYQAADAVTVLSDDLRDNVAGKIAGRRGGDPAKVRVIPNFVDTDTIRPLPRDNAYRREHGLVGKTVVLYAGNVGMSQSLDLVVAAAEAFLHDPDVAFVVNGGGTTLDDLRRRAAGLPNLHFVGMQPRERLPEVLAAGDIHLVPLKRGLARSSVPSKTYSILAAGRPVVASIDPGTEVTRILAAADAGLAVPPGDAEAFTKAIRTLVEAPATARRLGANGRRWVESAASPRAVAQAYEALFDELCQGVEGGRWGGAGAER